MGILSNNMISQLQSALNRTSLNQRLISQNIANVDTPNYKAEHISFNDHFQNSLKANRTEPQHIPFSNDNNYRVVEDQSTSMQNNGNNVDIDKEMASLAKNQIQYQTLVQLMNSQFSDIKTVIKGG